MSRNREPNRVRFSIDPASVVAARAELQEIIRGTPLAEAAVEGYSDWQVIEAMERIWAAGTSEIVPTSLDRARSASG